MFDKRCGCEITRNQIIKYYNLKHRFIPVFFCSRNRIPRLGRGGLRSKTGRVEKIKIKVFSFEIIVFQLFNRIYKPEYPRHPAGSPPYGCGILNKFMRLVLSFVLYRGRIYVIHQLEPMCHLVFVQTNNPSR